MIRPKAGHVTRWVAGLFVCGLLLVWGCAGASPSAKAPIAPGMRPETVTARLGDPARRELFAPDRFVYFYDSGPYRDRPLCFDKYTLAHIGPELLDAWRQERLAIAESGQGTGQLSPKAKARVKATLKAERDSRIDELERQVKPLPVSDTTGNLKLYRELLSLDPDNGRYRSKVNFYRERYEAEQAERKRATELAAKQRQEAARKRRNKALRVYEGSDTLQVAVHELGGGELYLWVKNLSEKTLMLVASQYRILDAEERPIALSVGPELQGALNGGDIAYGKLRYDGRIKPSRLVLEHPEAGVVEKWFP